MNNVALKFLEKLVATYGSLHTFYAQTTSESDEHFERSEPVKRIRHDTTVFEAEEIMTTGTSKRYKSLEQIRDEFKLSMKARGGLKEK